MLQREQKEFSTNIITVPVTKAYTNTKISEIMSSLAGSLVEVQVRQYNLRNWIGIYAEYEVGRVLFHV
jgi:hypothetical protein